MTEIENQSSQFCRRLPSDYSQKRSRDFQIPPHDGHACLKANGWQRSTEIRPKSDSHYNGLAPSNLLAMLGAPKKKRD